MTEIENKILKILYEDIKPALAEHDGDASFISYENGIVKLVLKGSCGTCSQSMVTLKMGIERLLKEEIPEIISVEQVRLEEE